MKILFFTVGCIAALLGMIGVLLPVLPTTPFFLLATFCFAKSSRRFHTWFIATSLYRNHIDSFVKDHSMSVRAKISILLFASLMLLIAMYFMENIWLRVFLGCLILFKYFYFIFRIKTISPAS